MSTPQYYDNGSYNVICDVCGRQFRAFQLVQRWDGLMVCKADYEPRQPQDFVRGVADKMAPPWTRPEPADTFINPYTSSVNHQINGAAINATEID
jgi:hypothetical protein